MARHHETLKTLALLGVAVAGTITIGVLNMPKKEGPAQQPEATAQLQTEVQRQAEKQTEMPKQTEAPRQTEIQTEKVTEAPQTETQKQTEKQTEAKPQYYFDETGVAVTKDFTITITQCQVFQGREGLNTYSDNPIIVFTYDLTNTSGKDNVTPSDWSWIMTAVQDNSDDYVNKLDVTLLFDNPYSDYILTQIKPGGTLQGAIAYDLTDLVTPVVLTATNGFLGKEIGKVQFPLP